MKKRKRSADPNSKKNYVTNSQLMPYIFKYRETGTVPEELGAMLLKIAENYSNKGSFHGYTWKDDMVADAVFTCIRYIHNFDPIRYEDPNPFAYFTSIVRNAFLNYIRKQKKHSKIKDVCYNNCHLIEKDKDFFETKGIDYTKLKDGGN
jgi:DNA-directed RNA polymerase specialized sigma24 family protein